MLFNKILTCLLLLATTQLFAANNTEIVLGGRIHGKVTTSDNKPAEEVTVILKSGAKVRTTITNENGLYEFTGLGLGNYQIEVSGVGYEPLNKDVVLQKNGSLVVDFKLKIQNKQLQEVIVEAKQKKLFIGKMNVPDRDLPLATGIINNKLIQDQQAIRLGDLVKNIPGVSFVQTRLGVNESYSARGYMIGNTGAAGGGSIFKNGLPYNIAGMPEAATLESVEVIKGSSAFLYGSSSGGLIINMINKKPKFEYGGNVSMLFGSYQQYKPVVDVYGPINNKIAFRIVGSYENDGSYRDGIKTIRKYINPSVLFKLGERTTLLVQQEYLNANLTPDLGIGMLDSGRVLNTSIPRSRNQNVRWAYNNVLQASASASLKHVFNERFTLQSSAMLQNTNVDSYGAGNLNTANTLGIIARPLARASSREKNIAAQINLEGKFTTKDIEHHFLTGLDFTSIVTSTDGFSILKENGTVLKFYDTINLLNPLQYTQPTYIPNVISTNSIMAPSNRAGIYVQDLVSLSKKFKFFMGLRYSYQATLQTTIDSSATSKRPFISVKGTVPTTEYRVLSPKAGLVFQPTVNTSYYLSYANNFTTNTGIDIYGNLLPASVIDHYELGAKQTYLKGRLSTNVSVYKIINSRFAQQAQYKADGITPNNDATVKTLSGETTSDGFELGLNGNLSNHFYFITGYAYNNIRFTNTAGSKGSNIEGEQLTNAPSNTANASIFYTFNNVKLEGFKIGLSGFYTGKRYGGYNNLVGQSILGSRLIALSDYTTIDITVAYNYKKIGVNCKLSNVFNTLNYLVHDNYSINPIAPRQFYTTLNYRF